jgi:hypothetical protein
MSPVMPRSRTGKVWTASIALAVFGALGLLLAGLLLAAANDEVSHGGDVPGVLYALVYIQFGLSALQMASGVLLWLGVRWAIGLATVICVINIFGNIVSLFIGVFLQAIVGLVVNVALLRLINSDEAAEWCGVTGRGAYPETTIRHPHRPDTRPDLGTPRVPVFVRRLRFRSTA